MILQRQLAEFEEEDMPEMMYVNSFILKRDGRNGLLTDQLTRQSGTYGLFKRVYLQNEDRLRPAKINNRDLWQSGTVLIFDINL